MKWYGTIPYTIPGRDSFLWHIPSHTILSHQYPLRSPNNVVELLVSNAKRPYFGGRFAQNIDL